MRHRKAGVKLNKTSSHRQAMFRNMVTSLFKYDRIRTTDAKAKELRRWADHMITLAKRGDLHARRQALAIIREKDVVHRLFEEAAGRFGAISGGYTRLVKLGARPGDAAPVTLVELRAAGAVSKKKAPKSQTASKSTGSETAPADGSRTTATAELDKAEAAGAESAQPAAGAPEAVEPAPVSAAKDQD